MIVRRLFGPLHLRAPSVVQPIIAPLQLAHLRLLDRQVEPNGPERLEDVVRQALLPTERLGDVEQWHHNLRLKSWLRNVYLRALPSTLENMPSVREAYRKRLEDPDAPPPSMEAARELFGLRYPTGERRQPALERAHDRPTSPPALDTDRATDDMPFGDVLEAAGGLVAHRGAWSTHCEEHGIYELVTHEMVNALATYIEERRPSLLAASAARDGADAHPPPSDTTLHPPSDTTLRVLEVGCGNGELSHYLRRELAARRVDASLVACDNGSWRLPNGAGTFGSIEDMSNGRALHAVAPHLVLVSWMYARSPRTLSTS